MRIHFIYLFVVYLQVGVHFTIVYMYPKIYITNKIQLKTREINNVNS